MSKNWPREKFGEFLRPNSRPYTLAPDQDANLIGMRLYGEGPFHRELKPAMQIAKKSHFVIRTGDVIFNKLFAWKGTFGVVPPSFDGMFVSDKFPTYELDRNRVDEKWLQWYFRYPPLWEEAQSMSTGSAALSKLTLNPPKFLLLTMPLPPLAEQRRVVALIDALAAQVQEARAIRLDAEKEGEALIRAHLNRLFGNPYEGVGGELGIAQWQKLDAVTNDVADGPHITPTYVTEGIPFITVLNITTGRVQFGNHKFVTPEDHKIFQQRAKAEKGDVLITKDGTLGVPCFVDTDREFSFFVSVALIKPKRGVLDGEFLTWALRAPYLQERIAARSRGDMIRHLVLREIRDLTVPVPLLIEQRRIVAYLDHLRGKTDILRALQAETSVELDALIPSILDKAFRGEL